MTKRKFFKTVFTLEILSEKPIPSDISLGELNYGITEGECSGELNQTEVKELNGKEIATALIAQGSDPEFFQINDSGEDVCDGCDGSGIRINADPSCNFSEEWTQLQIEGWEMVERCDLHDTYENDLDAARAIFHETKWIKCSHGDEHAIGRWLRAAGKI